MATRLPDGSIQLNDGRILYANSIILAQDLVELIPLLAPPPVWPFVSGGGGGTGIVGRNGANGSQGNQGPSGAAGGAQGAQGNQGTAGANGVQGNQGNQGPTGSGAQGSQGNQGTAGADGVQGAQGNQGPTGIGAQGAQGNQGASGTNGSQGIQGNQGSTGPQGVQGNQGSSGSQGNQGNQGSLGTQGNQGSQGVQGDEGPQGPQGFQGNVGVQGVQGAQGFQGSGGPQGTQGNQGNQGAVGAQGAQGAQGDEGPQGVQGNQGNQGAVGAQGVQGFQGDEGPQGLQGAQGNQGNQGAQGAQGFQGNDGSQGPQGAQGFQGNGGTQGTQGFQGSQGAQGFQGWQGFQGDLGPQGPQGFQGFQGFQGPSAALAADIFASDRVVANVAALTGVGTDTTIAAAVAALPAAGGTIYLKQGTYSLGATVTLADKPIDIIGSGDGTIIDLGANAIAAFTIPDTMTSRHTFRFMNFKITGNSAASQSIVDDQDSNFLAVVKIKGVNTGTNPTSITFPVTISGAGFSEVLDVEVEIEDCWFVPTPLTGGGAPTSSVVNNTGFEPATVTMRSVNFMVDLQNTIGGTLNNDSFAPTDFALYDCNIAWVGEDAPNTVHAERCRLFNYQGQGAATNATLIFSAGTGVIPDEIHPEWAFIDCNVVGMAFDLTEAVNVVGGWWDTTTFSASVVNGKCQITGTTFRTDSINVPQFPHFGATPTAYINGGGELAIVSCRFGTSGPNACNRYIEAPDSFYIAYCAFANLAAGGGVNSGIHVTGPNNVIIGNDFDALWAAPPIKEEGTNIEGNVYDANIGMNGNGGTDSVFVTPSLVSPSTFNSSALFNVTGTTTDAFVLLKMTLSGLGTSDPGIRENPKGLLGTGTIKNTGANSMDVRQTVTDLFGVTDNIVTTVAAGGDLLLSVSVNIATARPPYSTYQIEVKSTVAGTPTTFNYKHTLNSEVTW